MSTNAIITEQSAVRVKPIIGRVVKGMRLSKHS